MKKLLLVRHAKAANENSVDDFERPLKPSGIEDATVMAQRLLGRNIIPQLIIASPALRALTTANIFSEHLAIHAAVTDEKIYNAGERSLLEVMADLPDERDFIALVGHNPGISQLIYYYTGELKDVATCAVALINFEIDSWREASANNGSLVYYEGP